MDAKDIVPIAGTNLINMLSRCGLALQLACVEYEEEEFEDSMARNAMREIIARATKALKQLDRQDND